MKKQLMIFILILGFGFKTGSAGERQMGVGSAEDGRNEKTVVVIDYGPVREPRRVEIPLVRERTALAVLQSVAKVTTRPAGSYVFVIAVDDLESKPGETAWYYEVDGKPAGELAYTKVLNGTRTIRWIYKKDVCSLKGKSEPLQNGERGESVKPLKY